jgi:hypothetical protein
MTTRRADGEDGVVLVVVALLLVTLLVTTAMVVGYGNSRQTRRDAQNIVDASALAAAAELDGDFDGSFGGNGDADHGAAEARGREYLEDNGLNDRGEVGISFIEQNESECIVVEVSGIDSRVWFGEIVGRDSLAVGATAYGCRGTYIEGETPTIALGPDVPAVHVAGVCADKEGFDTSGNQIRFEGDIYAHDNPKDGGSGNHLAPGSTARYRGNVLEPGNLWNTPPAQRLGENASAASWPAAFDPTTELPISYFDSPTGLRALAYGAGLTGGGVNPFYTSTSQKLWNSATPAGVYFITGSGTVEIKGGFSVTPRQGWLRIDPVTGLPKHDGTPKIEDGRGVTFVTQAGVIKISDAGHAIEAFNWELNRLVFYASWTDVVGADRCSKPSIEFSGNCIHVNGIVYAPRGAVNIGSGEGTGNDHNGSTCTSRPDWSGGMIGYGFKGNGNKGLLRSGPGTITSNPGGPGDAGRIYLGG